MSVKLLTCTLLLGRRSCSKQGINSQSLVQAAWFYNPGQGGKVASLLEKERD